MLQIGAKRENIHTPPPPPSKHKKIQNILNILWCAVLPPKAPFILSLHVFVVFLGGGGDYKPRKVIFVNRLNDLIYDRIEVTG